MNRVTFIGAARSVPVTAAAKPGADIGYRPDIDGLRAIAVLSVVVFHAGIGAIPGGFVGVDVFFVISGYLIGGHIYAEAVTGRFRFGAFYARRTRRILPALFAMLLTVFALGLALLTPLELRELGKEAASSVFGLSNLLFYTGGGYFAPAADLDPLLMTWSLGVEEQFYVLFPFVVLLAVRFGRRVPLPVVAALSLMSLAGSLALMPVNAKACFYLLPPRMWELGLGTVLALWERRPGHAALERARAEPLGLAGAALLAAALFLYRPEFAFPGWFVLLPTVGTVLLIATRASAINRLVLSQPAIVFVGKVSYSWYLWHWPLFWLNRLLAQPGPGAPPAVLLLTSFALAVLSWRFVEQPARRRVLPQPIVLRRYAAAAIAMALLSGTLYATGGMIWRLPVAVRASAQDAQRARGDVCLAAYGADAPRNLDACVPPLSSTRSGRLLILGDSHASAIAPGFAALARQRGIGFGEVAKASCPPLWGYAPPSADRAGHWAQCTAFQARAFEQALRPDVGTVLLAGLWSESLTVRGAAGDMVSLRTALGTTIDRLRGAGKRVILVQDVPMFGFDPYARIIGDALPMRATLAALLRPAEARPFAAAPLPDRARPVLDEIATARPGVGVIDPAARLCGGGLCRYGAPQTAFYFDFQHLTAAGALAATGGPALRSAAGASVDPLPDRRN